MYGDLGHCAGVGTLAWHHCTCDTVVCHFVAHVSTAKVEDKAINCFLPLLNTRTKSQTMNLEVSLLFVIYFLIHLDSTSVLDVYKEKVILRRVNPSFKK